MGKSKMRRLQKRIAQLEAMTKVLPSLERQIAGRLAETQIGSPAYPKKKFHVDGRTAVALSVDDERRIMNDGPGVEALPDRGWCDTQTEAERLVRFFRVGVLVREA